MKGTVVHDLSKTTGVIAESVGVMEANGDDTKPTVVSRALFTRAQDGGYAEAFDEIETDAKFSSMARIEFPHKMVNPFMTYRSRFWPVVLGISQKEFEGIVHCRLVWDRVEERLVDSRTVTQIKDAIERYSICGAALLDYLEKVQSTIEDKYKQELIKLVFKPSSRYNVYDAIKHLHREPTADSMYVFDGWYIDLQKVVSIGFNLQPAFMKKVQKLYAFKDDQQEEEEQEEVDGADDSEVSDEPEEEMTDEEYEAYEELSKELDFSDADTIYKAFSQDEPTEFDSSAEETDGVEYEDLEEYAEVDETEYSEESLPEEATFEDSVEESDTEHAFEKAELLQWKALAILKAAQEPFFIQKMKDTIISEIPVLPLGLRRSFMGKFSPMTQAYNRLYQAARTTKDILVSAVEIPYRADAILKLQQAIELVTVGNENLERLNKFKGYKSLVDVLKGKHGRLRDSIEGTRYDYTGRAVISSNEDLSVKQLGVPAAMLAYLFAPVLRKAYAKSGDPEGKAVRRMVDLDDPAYIAFCYRHAKKRKLIISTGRQPSLHILSNQLYEVVPTLGNTIEVSPLVVGPFNADFDGDQMYLLAVLTKEAINEFGTGAIGRVPVVGLKGNFETNLRLESAYGIHVAIKGFNGDYEPMDFTKESFLQYAEDHGVLAEDYQVIPALQGGTYDTFDCCLYYMIHLGVVCPDWTIEGVRVGQYILEMILGTSELEQFAKEGSSSKLDVSKITEYIVNEIGEDQFADVMLQLVQIGNGFASNCNVVLDIKGDSFCNDDLQGAITDFEREQHAAYEEVRAGRKTDLQYDTDWAAKYNQELRKTILQKSTATINEQNGFRYLADIGVKGNQSNVQQILACVGQPNSSMEVPFDIAIKGCYAKGLTMLEQSVMAHTGRDGLVAKTLSTSKPGYMSRKLLHASARLKIAVEDCGTSDGLKYYPKDVIEMYAPEDYHLKWFPEDMADPMAFLMDAMKSAVYSRAVQSLAKMLVGKWLVKPNGEQVQAHTKEEAQKVIQECWGYPAPNVVQDEAGNFMMSPVIVRSPITCKCPICSKCYGRDWFNRKDIPEVGTQIGLLSAEAISEPGTQLTMKVFQNGGVAGGKANYDFDKIARLLDIGAFKPDTPGFDYLSPVEGYVSVAIKDNKQWVSIYDDLPENGGHRLIRKSIPFASGVKLNEYVKAGESVREIPGLKSPKNLLEARGAIEAAKVLAMILHSVYSGSDVRLCYIETILSSMEIYELMEDSAIRKDGSYYPYPAGSTVTADVYWALDPKPKAALSLIGIKYLPKYSSSIFEALLLENAWQYLPKTIMYGNELETNPFGRLGFGLDLEG